MLKRRYTGLELIARGAESTVWRGTDRLTGQQCAIKRGGKVLGEASLALSLHHPYIATPFDCGNDEADGPYAVYPYYSAPSLREFFLADVTPDNRLRVALQICEVLCFLHSKGWLYVDFKPENFLISPSGVMVLDLGLCKRMDSSPQSSFAGTFPYISPEALLGRSYDVRSELFALGVLLLHSFYMKESWNGEPSLSLLVAILEKQKNIPGFWGECLGSLTAMEPGQRIPEALELWRRLLPPAAAKMVLFFPSSISSGPGPACLRSRFLSIVSPSSCFLQAAEDQLMLGDWSRNTQVVPLDFSRSDIPGGFRMLCSLLTDQVPANVFDAVQILKGTARKARLRVGFRFVDRLRPRDHALLQYVSSSLQKVDWLDWYTTSTQAPGLPETEVYGPLPFNREESSRFLSQVLPDSRDAANPSGAPLSGRYPEDILQELRARLPPDWDHLWPAGARSFTSIASWERETGPASRKVILLLSLAGGALRISILRSALGMSERSLASELSHLLSRGVLTQQGDMLLLRMDSRLLNASYRRTERKFWAGKLAAALPEDESPDIVYRVLAAGGQNRSAALVALRAARKERAAGHGEGWRLWAGRACNRGARLPPRLILSLASFCLRKGELKYTSWLLKKARARGGRTLRLSRARINLLHRAHRIQHAIDLCRVAVLRSVAIGHTFWAAYFRVRQAGFHILQQELEPAARLLDETDEGSLPDSIRGLILHYRGLLSYYKGEIQEAIEWYQKAAELPHEFRVTSIMNLGVAYLKQDKLQEAGRALRRSLRLFHKMQDAERLSHCYNNLGVLHKEVGALREARESYQKATQLAHLCGNRSMQFHSRLNLAVTFEREGNTNQAIQTYEGIIQEAQKLNIRAPWATSLTNIGLLYALKGQKVRAVRAIKTGIRIKKEMGLEADLGYSYENLGLSLLFLGRFRAACHYLNKARDLFSEKELRTSKDRAQLLLTICDLEARNDTSQPDPAAYVSFRAESLESGLLHYARGAFLLEADPFQPVETRTELYEAERVFRKLPSLIWLAKSLQLKSRYHGKRGNAEKAALAHAACVDILSKVGAVPPSEPEDYAMTPSGDYYNNMTAQLPYRLLLMIKDILSLDRPDAMIQHVLNAALEFSDMERAVLILLEKPPRIFRSASVEDGAIQDICEISNSALATVSAARAPFVCLDAAVNAQFQGNPSIIANRIMSIVCLPLTASGVVTGVLYLDSREGVESLTRSETVLMEIFASIISMILEKAMALERSLAENSQVKEAKNRGAFPEFVGVSRQVLEIRRQVRKLQDTDITVLITGETGTGKELVARVIHYTGNRRNGPFLAVNCSAFSKELLESELFGHEKGAFTGATQQKRGLFEQADGGTFFLDEIGEMPWEMQAKVLRVLESREFRRVGGLETLHTSARMVLATHRDLEKMVQEASFREDLYYRIKGVQVRIPPMRERAEDILPLADAFLRGVRTTTRRTIHGFSPEAQELIRAYNWPGNARQLKNEIERIVALSEGEWIDAVDFEPGIQQAIQSRAGISSESLREVEKRFIVERLQEFDGNVLFAAKSLGLSRHGLYSKMRRYGIAVKKQG